MSHGEIVHILNRLPNMSEPMGPLSSDDRSWLIDFRLRFASGEVPSLADEGRLLQIVQQWDEG